MNAIAVADVVKSIRNLPVLPLIVMDLLRSFESADLSTGELADKLANDQALVAKTLRLANSSFYGLSRKVGTIQQAITILGFDSVRALVTAASVTDCLPSSPEARHDVQLFWRHAVGTALCARHLAHHQKKNVNYAFVCGLLHDIGKLVLLTRFPDEYRCMLEHREKNDCTGYEAERAVLGVDHTFVGRALAECWKFPPAMQRIIANHHLPDTQDLGDVGSIVHVADAIVHGLDLAGRSNAIVPEISEKVWTSLNLNQTLLNTVFRETEEGFEDTCQILAGA